jgi:hypothetical protein
MRVTDRLGRSAAGVGRAGRRAVTVAVLAAFLMAAAQLIGLAAGLGTGPGTGRGTGPGIGSGIGPGLAGLAGGSAWAAGDPPDVRGLTPAAARQALLAWNRSTVVTFSPTLADLPAGTDPSTVVAVRSALVNTPQFAAAAAPQVTVTLGTLVPDLTGDTLATATELLARHGLRLAPRPVDAAPDWLVTGQEVQPATLVDFRSPLAVFLVAPPVVATVPASPPPVVRPGPLRPVVLIAAGSSAAVLLLLAVLGPLALRRARRARRSPPLERVEVRAHPGRVVGPELVELAPRPGQPGTVGVRLEPRYDPGTFLIEEDHR